MDGLRITSATWKVASNLDVMDVCRLKVTSNPDVMHGLQIDVTAEVMAQEQVRQAYALLEDEKGRTDALLLRQHDLIECLGWVGEMGRTTLGSARSAELFDSFRQQLTIDNRDGKMGGEHGVQGKQGRQDVQEKDQVEMLQLIGEGSVSGSSAATLMYYYTSSH